MPPSPINHTLAARADAARARLRRESPELGGNALSLAEVLGLPEARLAELVAVDHFGWRLVNNLPQIFETPPAKGLAYATRPFRPCTNANDDQLALRFVRVRHRPLLGSMAVALLDLATARTAGVGAPLDQLMVTVVYRTGDYCRALLLIASTTWQADRARRGPTDRSTPPKEPHHEVAQDQTSPPNQQAAPAGAGAAHSPSVGAGAATPAPHASSPQTFGDSHGLPTRTV
jgi:hypothetical protein